MGMAHNLETLSAWYIRLVVTNMVVGGSREDSE